LCQEGSPVPRGSANTQHLRHGNRSRQPSGHPDGAAGTLVGALPAELRSTESWTRCIGGTHPLEDYLGKLKAAGFADGQVVTSPDWQPLMLSVKIKAVKAP
jgi:hypothetical protein